MKLRGDAIRTRRTRPLSGPNIPESQRHTIRVRISPLAHAMAVSMAKGRSVGEVIEDAVRAAANVEEAKPRDGNVAG